MADTKLKKLHKQATHEVLPSRFAMSELTGGDVANRSMGNYAKSAPAPDNQPYGPLAMMAMMRRGAPKM
jgi:hypothetical protein